MCHLFSPGDICPLGHYCPAGSSSGIACLAGTYLDSTGNYNSSACISCTPGMYCSGTGLPAPSGNCSRGYYCPGGQDNPTPVGLECTQGHYCLEGKSSPDRCPAGSYQDDVGQWMCKGCPAGYYCDDTLAAVVLYNNSACPEGFYCPDNTTFSTQYPCPLGTFSNTTHRTDSSECQACTGGMFCSQTGLTEPEGPCNAGMGWSEVNCFISITSIVYKTMVVISFRLTRTVIFKMSSIFIRLK